MRPTHNLIIYDDHIVALGNDGYFSWIIEYSYGEWDLSTIYGNRHRGSFETLGEALDSIGYQEKQTLLYERDLPSIYWHTIPKDMKRKVKIKWGDEA